VNTDQQPTPLAGLFNDPKHLRADLRLVRTAIRNGWAVPAATRAELVRRLSGFVAGNVEVSDTVRNRLALSSCMALLEASCQPMRLK